MKKKLSSSLLALSMVFNSTPSLSSITEVFAESAVEPAVMNDSNIDIVSEVYSSFASTFGTPVEMSLSGLDDTNFATSVVSVSVGTISGSAIVGAALDNLAFTYGDFKYEASSTGLATLFKDKLGDEFGWEIAETSGTYTGSDTGAIGSSSFASWFNMEHKDGNTTTYFGAGAQTFELSFVSSIGESAAWTDSSASVVVFDVAERVFGWSNEEGTAVTTIASANTTGNALETYMDGLFNIVDGDSAAFTWTATENGSAVTVKLENSTAVTANYNFTASGLDWTTLTDTGLAFTIESEEETPASFEIKVTHEDNSKLEFAVADGSTSTVYSVLGNAASYSLTYTDEGEITLSAESYSLSWVGDGDTSAMTGSSTFAGISDQVISFTGTFTLGDFAGSTDFAAIKEINASVTVGYGGIEEEDATISWSDVFSVEFTNNTYDFAEAVSNSDYDYGTTYSTSTLFGEELLDASGASVELVWTPVSFSFANAEDTADQIFTANITADSYVTDGITYSWSGETLTAKITNSTTGEGTILWATDVDSFTLSNLTVGNTASLPTTVGYGSVSSANIDWTITNGSGDASIDGYVISFDGAGTFTLSGSAAAADGPTNGWSYREEFTVAAATEYVNVTINAENLGSSVLTNTTHDNSKDFTCQLSRTENYTLPETITVTVDGVSLTVGTDYTYTNGLITISATKVTGNIVITAVGAEVEDTVEGFGGVSNALDAFEKLGFDDDTLNGFNFNNTSYGSVTAALSAGVAITTSVGADGNFELELSLDMTNLVFEVAVDGTSVDFSFSAGSADTGLEFFSALVNGYVDVVTVEDDDVTSSVITFEGTSTGLTETPKMELTFDLGETEQDWVFLVNRANSSDTWAKSKAYEVGKSTTKGAYATMLGGNIISFTNGKSVSDESVAINGTWNIGEDYAINNTVLESTSYPSISVAGADSVGLAGLEITFSTDEYNVDFEINDSGALSLTSTGNGIYDGVTYSLTLGKHDIYEVTFAEGAGTWIYSSTNNNEIDLVASAKEGSATVTITPADTQGYTLDTAILTGDSHEAIDTDVLNNVLTFADVTYTIDGGTTYAVSGTGYTTDYVWYFTGELDDSQVETYYTSQSFGVSYGVYDTYDDNWTMSEMSKLIITETVGFAGSDIHVAASTVTSSSYALDFTNEKITFKHYDYGSSNDNNDDYYYSGGSSNLTNNHFAGGVDGLTVTTTASNVSGNYTSSYGNYTSIVEFLTLRATTSGYKTIQLTNLTAGSYIAVFESANGSTNWTEIPCNTSAGASATMTSTGIVEPYAYISSSTRSVNFTTQSGYYYSFAVVSPTSSGSSSSGGSSSFSSAVYYDAGSVRVNGSYISELRNVLVGELVNLNKITTVNGQEVLGWYYDSAMTQEISNASQFVVTSSVISDGIYAKTSGSTVVPDSYTDGSTNAGNGSAGSTGSNTYVPSVVPSTVAKLLGKLF